VEGVKPAHRAALWTEHSLGTDTEVYGSKTTDVFPHSLQTRCDLYWPPKQSATCESFRAR